MEEQVAAAVAQVQGVEHTALYQWGGYPAVMAGFIGIIVVAFIVSAVVQKPIYHALGANERRRVGGTVFSNIVRILVWGTAVAFVCDLCFGIDVAGLIGALGVIGIAISLGAQQTIANLFGGVLVSTSKVVGVGDWITVGDSEPGRVLDTDWRRTIIQSETGNVYAIPNSFMVAQVVKKNTPWYQLVVPFAISTKVDDVGRLCADMARVSYDSLGEHGYRFEDMTPLVHVAGTDVDVIRVEAKLYVTREADHRAIERDVLPDVIGFLQAKGVLARTNATDEDALLARAIVTEDDTDYNPIRRQSA